jgi:nicotinamide-nucleotide amidase
MIFPDDLWARAETLVALCRDKGLTFASAESCTGGLLAGLVTSVPGASDIFDRGFVTYSNAAKVECLGVSPDLLERVGAVSAEVAAAMATGALGHSRADIALSITGIAGPGGGSAAKPVGLVHFGLALRAGTVTTVEKRFGDVGRDAVRAASLAVALELLLEAAGRGAAG